MNRYEVITQRRTARFTVYSIYDHERRGLYEQDGKPFSTRDRAVATQRAYGLNHVRV